MIVKDDEIPTTAVPRVAPVPPRSASRLRTVLPWVGVGLLAIVVLGGTTIWSASVRPASDPQIPTITAEPAAVATPPPTTTAAAPTTVAAAPPIRHTVPRAVRTTPPAVVATTTAPAATRTTVVTTKKKAASAPFGLGSQASCQDPGSATRPECQGQVG